MLDLVQTLHEFVSECFDPVDIALFNLKKSVSDLCLPLGNDVDVWRVLGDRLRRILLDLLEIFKLLLVLLVDVLEVFFGHDALEALILLECSRVESGWGVVLQAVYAQGRVWEFLLRVHHERVVDQFLAHVAFHVFRRLGI